MTQRRLNFIIALMTVALVGLTALQSYWIIEAMSESRVKFKQSVHDALSAVSERLEQREVLYVTQNTFFPDGQRSYHKEMDTLTLYNNWGVEANFDIGLEDTVPEAPQNEISVDINDKDNALSLLYTVKSDAVQNNADEDRLKVKIRHIDERMDSVLTFGDKFERKVRERTQMITVVLNELYAKERKINNRIDPNVLDSLMHAELGRRGLDLPFFYVVRNTKGNTAQISNIYKNRNTHLRKLANSKFRISLFPNDILGSPYYLKVYFPEQNVFIFLSVWLRLLAAVILLGVIVYGFVFSILTIIKQKKLSEMKNDFINNMTHEFKTPISTVSLACEALGDPDMRANSGILDRYLGIIKEENQRLGSQVEKVLQIAKLERKDFSLHFEKVDAHQLIMKAVQNFNLQVDKRNGRIDILLNAKRHVVEIDPLHFSNIIDNLLDNAVKYCVDKAPLISVHTESTDIGLRLRISDNGIGMSKEAIRHIFDKFYRISTGDVHNVKGFGLGLAYVKMMVEAMKGRISVSSMPGKGSTFEIVLPYEQAEIPTR
ncbi:two-component sensor histidine kinase [Fulvitalea axinellae]|uniref:histidine kinase n=1 Tax=Fulvitalea axinellae TaxID=1182444 RepID=A0AAU9D9U6_9BACT|nr:two-component sensor histidine kinase [Fulvitalea axinellae]